MMKLLATALVSVCVALAPTARSGPRRQVRLGSMPNFTPEQMAEAAKAMQTMTPEQMRAQSERMMEDIENMGPEEKERMKKMGMNPDLLKMSMKMMKANPSMLEAAQKQMAQMSPDQLAQASEMAQRQMSGMTSEQMDQIVSTAQPTIDVQQAVEALPKPYMASDQALVDALWTVASATSDPPGSVDLKSFSLLPPVAQLRGDLADDLTDAEIQEVWDGVAAGSPTLDKANFEKVWRALDDLYDDDLMVEARRPPKA